MIYYYLKISLLQTTHLYEQLIRLIDFTVIIIKLDIAFFASMFLKYLINCHNITSNSFTKLCIML